MKYQVRKDGKDVEIEVTEAAGQQAKLMAAFQECQEGRCTCPTQEYEKLESLEIESDADTIRLKLKAKPDAQLDETEINKCLEYTQAQVAKDA